MATSNPPCDRCGTFTEQAALRWLPPGTLCPACYALVLKSTPLWGLPYIVLIGAIFMPVGWVLAAINWSRLGRLGHGLLLVAGSVGARVLVLIALAVLKPAYPPYGAGGVFYASSAATMLISVIGLKASVAEQRAAGGRSASRLLPLGGLIIPFVCFVGVYQFFAHH